MIRSIQGLKLMLLVASLIFSSAASHRYHDPHAVPDVVPVGGSCRGGSAVCDAGLVCAGGRRSKRCVYPIPLGEACRDKPFWICADEGRCIGGRCTQIIGTGGSCLESGTICSPGLFCVGTDIKKICVAPGDLGESCGADPFWICVSGLDCIGGVCSTPEIGEGSSCSTSGPPCKFGLTCFGPSGGMTCVRPIPINGECNFGSLCDPGLDCIDGRCSKVVSPGGSCLESGTICMSGSICEGTSFKKICVVPGELGDRCEDDAFSFCVSDLKCIRGVCSKPELGEGETCSENGIPCEAGLVCYVRRGLSTCVRPVPLGGFCSRKTLCAAGLQCIAHKCSEPFVGVGGSCIAEGAECESGLVCVGTSSEQICVAPLGEGAECGLSPFQICAKGLWCYRGFCRLD